MSRTKKQPYRKSRRFDKTCRSNGSCSYCFKNRYHKHLVKIHYTNIDLKEIKNGNKTETTDNSDH